jgi:hypothetical protein
MDRVSSLATTLIHSLSSLLVFTAPTATIKKLQIHPLSHDCQQICVRLAIYLQLMLLDPSRSAAVVRGGVGVLFLYAPVAQPGSFCCCTFADAMLNRSLHRHPGFVALLEQIQHAAPLLLIVDDELLQEQTSPGKLLESDQVFAALDFLRTGRAGPCDRILVALDLLQPAQQKVDRERLFTGRKRVLSVVRSRVRSRVRDQVRGHGYVLTSE